MNGLGRTATRLIQNCVKNTTLTGALVNRAQAPVKRDFTRGIWHMSCSQRMDGSATTSTLLHNHSNTCSCGCGMKALHTKETEVDPSTSQLKPRPLGERELVEFLTEEIVAERKAQKVKVLPAELEGFVVCGDGAEVVLSKKLKDELVRITFNVNHTVDSDDLEGEVQPEKQEFAEMRSRPQFEVDLVRGDTTLGFTCSYLQEPPPAAGADEYNDVFGIDEVTIYKGEWNDKVYAVAGDVLDGYLYDLLMNLLEEKGISNEFVNKLSDFSTAYEHSAYIKLLESVSQFTIGK
ncbi:complement component 1 Q subcomponent-binding protein, mitochondrial isoform X1 [Spodoptera frugiperda]|uniref:Complement component 1 Q subcomponent-binding protein, mitochondrial isoform X1 n=1 Tax=Spodoptera frugiperda TaxID=7108 RepID=A0A9R0D4C4_SPOFR|nr:complement component 1 Q subcomponent-binding protein, mitochondrial isoform X1 [Spodoptera frugiperda]